MCQMKPLPPHETMGTGLFVMSNNNALIAHQGRWVARSRIVLSPTAAWISGIFYAPVRSCHATAVGS